MSEEWKVAVLGSGGVGKSCLTVRLVQGQFVEGMDPTIEDSYQKFMDIDGAAARLDILDTAGQEDYANMRDQYFRECQGFVFVYSITHRKTFEEIQALYDGLLRVKEKDPWALVVVGNKADLEKDRKVEMSEGEAKAKECKAIFFETSSKTNQNVTETFTELVKSLRKVGWADACSCKAGKCTCKEKCSKCGRQRNMHKKADHGFKTRGGGGSICAIL